jgi:competence protein ComEC
VKITFLNVGQGDSIILEWEENSVKKIGIVDCNLYKGSNPVAEYILNLGVNEIEFIILSHPHFDHFSGMLDLLNKCIENGILVKKFLHTSSSTPDFLKSASRNITADEELFRLFDALKKMRDSGKLSIYSIDDNPDLVKKLDEDFSMSILSPSSKEIDNFIRGVKYPFDEEDSTGNPNANWLSTVIKIHNDSLCVLLTSDVEASSLSRIGKKKGGRINNKKVILSQVPHHGSKGNLNKSFWQMRRRADKTPAVISVGDNGYKHPSSEVLSFFDRTPNYVLYSTNLVGSLVVTEKSVLETCAHLDLFSEDLTVETLNKYSGNQVFSVSKDGCIPLT